MKKIILITLSTGLFTAIAHGQGYIITQNVIAGIQTNTSSFYAQNQGSFTTGLTDRGVDSFYYALLCSPTLPTGNTDPSNSSWTLVTQQNGANLAINNSSILFGGLTGTGTSVGVSVNMKAGETYDVELVGWSANLGSTFAAVLGQYETHGWQTSGYFGFTGVSTMTPFATAGAGDPTLFPTAFPNNSFQMYSVSLALVPEPSTIALASIGGLALLRIRRKK